MHQVFFEIPFVKVPVYGYGVMLCVAFIVCTWLASRRGRREGFEPHHIQDIGIWIFLLGIVGGRLFAWIFEPTPGQKFFWDFFKIWHGGLVFYGSVVGGLAGYLAAYFRIVRPNKLSSLQFGDIITPSIAMGICLGRIGCFFTGCCYGDYADPVAVSWGLQFPGNSPPQAHLVKRGLQTAYGFVLEPPQGPEDRPETLPTVREVDTNAAGAGLHVGDRIIWVWSPIDNHWIEQRDLANLIVRQKGQDQRVQVSLLWYVLRHLNLWRPGDPLDVVVSRAGQGDVPVRLEPLPSLPVHPTQLYSAFDGLLLFLLTTAYYPFRKRVGEVLALLMILYAVNRFLIEELRNDTDFVWFGVLTLSQGISVLTFIGGIVLAAWLRSRPALSPTHSGRSSGGKRETQITQIHAD